MSGDLLDLFANQWQLVTTALGGLGVGGLSVRHLYKRLHPDQQLFVDAVEHLDKVSDELEAIVGRPEVRIQDCERIRAANAHRRRVGLAIKDLFSGGQLEPFTMHLSNLSRALGVVEDLVNMDGAVQSDVRAACQEACKAGERLRTTLVNKAKRRPSVLLFGRKKFDLKEK